MLWKYENLKIPYNKAIFRSKILWAPFLLVAYNIYGFGLTDITSFLAGIPRVLRSRSTNDKLVVFNAIGKRNNIALIEHARMNHFKPDEWDCMAFMFQAEDQIPDDDTHLRKLIDGLGCSIPRTPGIDWGNFLLALTPTFVSNYDYLALVLDDAFLPDNGPNAINVYRLVEQMKEHDISIISPGVMGDSHKVIDVATELGYETCIAEVNMLESHVQLFTREAWECYYKMLHYSGVRGWCYNLCFKSQCPDMILAQDFSMVAWHMGNITEIPSELIVDNPTLQAWNYEPPLRNYTQAEDFQTCARLGCGEPAYTQESLEQNLTIQPLSKFINVINCLGEGEVPVVASESDEVPLAVVTED